MTVLSIYHRHTLFHQIGRKPLLLVGGIGMLASIVGAGVVIQATGVDKMHMDHHIAAGYAVVILVCFFVFNFAFSWG